MRSCPLWLRLHLLAVALLLALPCPSVLAKGSGESSIASAERAKGMVALNLGRYDEAIEHLSQAYTLTQDPMLLYSLGQAYRLAGKPREGLWRHTAPSFVPPVRCRNTGRSSSEPRQRSRPSPHSCSIDRRIGAAKRNNKTSNWTT